MDTLKCVLSKYTNHLEWASVETDRVRFGRLSIITPYPNTYRLVPFIKRFYPTAGRSLRDLSQKVRQATEALTVL